MELKWTEYSDRSITFKVDYSSIRIYATDGEATLKFTIQGKELIAGVSALASALPTER